MKRNTEKKRSSCIKKMGVELLHVNERGLIISIKSPFIGWFEPYDGLVGLLNSLFDTVLC